MFRVTLLKVHDNGADVRFSGTFEGRSISFNKHTYFIPEGSNVFFELSTDFGGKKYELEVSEPGGKAPVEAYKVISE